MRFSCIRAHESQFDVRMMCRVVDVSASGYYRWRERPPAARSVQDAELLVRLREHHRASRQTYGVNSGEKIPNFSGEKFPTWVGALGVV